jgi:antitoxin VapB
MVTVKVLRRGGAQIVRVPKQFRLKGEEVEVFRRGEEIILREKSRGMARAFELLASLQLGRIPKDGPTQKRKGL